MIRLTEMTAAQRYIWQLLTIMINDAYGEEWAHSAVYSLIPQELNPRGLLIEAIREFNANNEGRNLYTDGINFYFDNDGGDVMVTDFSGLISGELGSNTFDDPGYLKVKSKMENAAQWMKDHEINA